MVRAKKKQKKKTPPSPQLTAEDRNCLQALLENPDQLSPADVTEQMTNAAMAQAFLEKLPADAPNVVDLIEAVREAFDHKTVQKAVKKTIFRLKQKGIATEALETSQPAAFLLKTLDLDDSVAYLSPVDGFGNRAVFLLIPQQPMGVDLGMGIINDESGILEFVCGRYSKKQSKDIKETFFQDLGEMIETSLPHAATLLEKAHSLKESGPGDPSADYLKLRPYLNENVPLLERAMVYEFLSTDNLPGDALTASQVDKLLNHPMMVSWIANPDKVKPLMEEIEKVQESPILVSEIQKTERIHEIKAKAIGDIYPRERRWRIKERLEEMAFIFFKQDEEDFAHLALVVAHSIKDEDSILELDPFLEAMVDRTLEYFRKEAEDTEQSGILEDNTTSGIIEY